MGSGTIRSHIVLHLNLGGGFSGRSDAQASTGRRWWWCQLCLLVFGAMRKPLRNFHEALSFLVAIVGFSNDGQTWLREAREETRREGPAHLPGRMPISFLGWELASLAVRCHACQTHDSRAEFPLGRKNGFEFRKSTFPISHTFLLKASVHTSHRYIRAALGLAKAIHSALDEPAKLLQNWNVLELHAPCSSACQAAQSQRRFIRVAERSVQLSNVLFLLLL